MDRFTTFYMNGFMVFVQDRSHWSFISARLQSRKNRTSPPPQMAAGYRNLFRRNGLQLCKVAYCTHLPLTGMERDRKSQAAMQSNAAVLLQGQPGQEPYCPRSQAAMQSNQDQA
jgi:hypothetical protein